MMFDGSDKTNHRDKEEEDPRGCDASNDGKVCDDSSDFAWGNRRSSRVKEMEITELTVNSHTDDEE